MKDLLFLRNCLPGLALFLFLSAANAESKSNLAKEKRWEEQIIPSIMVGEGIKLKADETEFLALYTEPSTDKSKGAVIIMHGIGVHPAWPDVISPLRMELPEHGWHTLSLQMPILDNDAENTDYLPLFPEVPSRIQAGVDYLKSKGIHNIVLSGHSLGSSMASYYMAKEPDSAIKAYALISAGPGVSGNVLADSLENFKKFKGVNILDLHGSEDMDFVLKIIKKREPLGKKLFGKKYQLIKIDGANHFYQGKQDVLVETVSDWLDKNVTL